MSDCSPLRLADNGRSSPSPSQSIASQNSGAPLDRRRQNQRRNYHHRSSGNTSGDNATQSKSRHQQTTRPRSPSEGSTQSGLKYGAKSVIDLFIPVSICMWIVVGTMKATDSFHYTSQSGYLWYGQMMFTDQNVDTETRVWHSLFNAMMMLSLIVCMTTLLIVLYKFRCYKTIYVWLLMSSLMLLLPFMIMYIAVFLKFYNIPMDSITLTIFIWNFASVGMICIHWKGPLRLQQAYLIMISSLMALVFIQCLPDWTVWSVLFIVSIWDLVAVLCPMGPLRILVELAHERDEPIFPALIYSSTMIWELATLTAHSVFSMADDNRTQNRPRRSDRPSTSRQVQQTSLDSPRKSNRVRRSSEQPSSPRKRADQHPVEIQYDEGAEPPQVSIIQPTSADLGGETSSRRGEEWNRAEVRAVRPRGAVNRSHRRSEEPMQGDHSTIDLNAPSRAPIQIVEEEERGVKLGLGDFIFFSVLVGKASSYNDWTITMSCYVSVLVGLCLTLSLLTLFRKALPALPISISFGLISTLLSYFFVVPLASDLAVNQVFV